MLDYRERVTEEKGELEARIKKLYRERVTEEEGELEARIKKLERFFGTETFVNLPHEEKLCIKFQYGSMRMYRDALQFRMELWEHAEA